MSAPAPQYQFSIRDTITAIVDEYARRHKPAAGQLGLFEKPEERQKPLFSKSVDDEAGRWVTMRGARVYISNDDGRIMKGPKKLIGKTKEQIEKESAEEGGPAQKPKGLAELGRISGGRADNRQKKLFEELNPGFRFEDDEEEDFKTVEPVAVAEASSSPADDVDPISALTDDVLHLRPGHQFEQLQFSLGVKKPAMGKQGTKNVQDALRKIPGGNVIAAMLATGSEHGHLVEFDSNGFPQIGNDAFQRVIDGKFSREDLNAAKEFLETNYSNSSEFGNVNQYRWLSGVARVAKPKPAESEEPQFTLDSTPAPSPAKPTDFSKPDAATKQGALFDTGKGTGDLKGQELLFNSDAGDLNNPKTMENRAKKEQDKKKTGDYSVGDQQFDSFKEAVQAAKESGSDVIESSTGKQRWTPGTISKGAEKRYRQRKAVYDAQQSSRTDADETAETKSPADSIQSHLDNDDHESAFGAFSKLKKDEVDKVARQVLGMGFYNKSKAQMLEALKRTLPLATKTASEAAQKKEEIDYAEMKLRKAKENQQAHSEDRLGAPIRSGVPEIAYTDPHGEGREEVAKAWQAEVDDAQRELDRVKGLKNQDQGKTEEKPNPSNPIESKEIHLIAKNVGLKTQKQITKKGMGTLVSNIDNGVKTMKEAAKPIATRIFDGIKNHGANEITENLLRHTMISGNAEIAFDRAIEEFSKKSSYQGNPLDLNIRDERKLFADEMKKNKKEILAAFRRPPESPDKYSREQLLQTMNGVIDRYIRPESEVVQVDKYAHPLIHAAVGAGAMALAGKVFKSGPLRSVAHAAIGAAMAAWMQSAMAANGIQPAQAPSSPAANVATVSPPASAFQNQQAGNSIVNQIVQNAINQNAAKAQAAANAPPSPAQVSAHSISAAAAGKAGVPGVRPLTGANAAGIPGRVQVVNPGQSQSAGKAGATAGKLPVTEPAGGSGSFNADHPRHPAGASEGRGGEFAPKGEVESGSSAPESSSSPADNSGVFDVWHSPKSSSSQGYSGAASAGLGDVFATDSHEYASQYGTPEKHTAKMQNPYQMSAAEFRSFDRGPDASFEKSKARRQELESAGHDGILVSHADGTKEHILFNRDNLTKQEASPRNYPDNLNKPASEQTDYSPPERSIEPPVRQSRKAAWEKHLQGVSEMITEKKESAKAEKQQAKELAKATSFNPAELETPLADDVSPVGEAPKEEDFDSAKDYESALEKHNRSKGAKQAAIKKRSSADLIPEIAGQYDLDHSTLQQAVDDEIQMLLPYHNRKEEARQYISKMGWNARRINQAEDRGIDSSSTKFDDVASQWASMFPEIAGSDESEWVAKMWDLSKEGAQDPPSASDEELVNRVAKRLADSGASSSPAEEEGFEYADPGPVSGEIGDVDYTPFHRKAVVDLIVDRYMRLAGIA